MSMPFICKSDLALEHVKYVIAEGDPHTAQARQAATIIEAFLEAADVGRLHKPSVGSLRQKPPSEAKCFLHRT